MEETYIVIQRYNKEEFEKDVSSWISMGYHCSGGVFVIADMEHEGFVYFQAMEKTFKGLDFSDKK